MIDIKMIAHRSDRAHGQLHYVHPPRSPAPPKKRRKGSTPGVVAEVSWIVDYSIINNRAQVFHQAYFCVTDNQGV